MTHRYQIGQILEMRSAPRHSNRPAGLCEVLSRLPHEGGPVLYRVQSVEERHERVVDEVDLTPSAVVKASDVVDVPVRNVAIVRR